MPKGVYKRTHVVSLETRAKLREACLRNGNIPPRRLSTRGEKPKCPICGKKLSSYEAKHCLIHKVTMATRMKISEAKRGKNNWNWKGGITPESKRLYFSEEYKLWRKAVFERDNYTCVWCGARNGNGKEIVLQADHIKQFCDYPELRFVLENGRTLCIDCHKKTDTYGWKNYNKKQSYKSEPLTIN